MTIAYDLDHPDLRILAALPFFAPLNANELRAIGPSVRRRRYRRHEIIHRVDDVAGDVFVISRGHVKHRITAVDGRQLTHSIQGPGEFFGMVSVIDHSRRAGDAVALTDCDLLVIDRDSILSFVDAYPEASAILLAHHLRALRQKLMILHDLAFLSVPNRLAKALLAYAEPAQDSDEHLATIPSYLNQTELAHLVSSTRESVNQCLQVFARQGSIRFAGRTICITDWEGLRKAAT